MIPTKSKIYLANDIIPMKMKRPMSVFFKLGVAKRVSPPRVWPAKMRVGFARPTKLLWAIILNPRPLKSWPVGLRASRIFFLYFF